MHVQSYNGISLSNVITLSIHSVKVSIYYFILDVVPINKEIMHDQTVYSSQLCAASELTYIHDLNTNDEPMKLT